MIREIVISSDQEYSKDRSESMSFVPLSKVNQNAEVCDVPVVSVSFRITSMIQINAL